MKQIKVLQLGTPSGLYGAERWILALVRNMPAGQIDFWVGAIKDAPWQQVPLCREAEASGFKTIVIESFGAINIRAVRLLREFIQKNGIDILHTHGYKTDFIGVLATKGTGCKVVSTPHGWTKKPDFKLFCYEFINRMLFPFCDAIVPLSRALVDPLRLIPGVSKKLHMIQNGVDITEIETIDTVAEEMGRWKCEGRLIAGYVGRLVTGKGVETLLSALVEPGMENWRLAIIGEGEKSEELKSLAQRLGLCDRVAFFGFRPDRLLFLKGFDAFVLPSESEGIPRCLMEAMAAKVPVVASDIPGCRYLVEHERTGLLFETNNARNLARVLLYLVSDTEFAQTLSNAAYEHVCINFSASRMAEEYSNLYESLVEDKAFQAG